MSKRLIALLVLAFVVGLTAGAFAEVQNVKVGGDLTVVGVTRSNLLFDDDAGDDLADADGIASIARIKIDANLTDNVDVTFRLLNERVWSTNSYTSENTDNVAIDLAYATVKNPFDLPSTVMLGRQEIKIGSGILIGAPFTNQSNSTVFPTWLGDLSARNAFDAIVTVWDFAPFTVIGGFVVGSEGDTNDGADVNVQILNAGYNFGEDAWSTVLQGTYVRQSDGLTTDSTEVDPIDNYGIRATMVPMENLGTEVEYVYQKDKGRTDSKKADAWRVCASFGFPDAVWAPVIAADYHKFSKYWDPMHESLTPAEIVNLLMPQSNVQAIGVSVSAKPMDEMMLKLRYATFDLTKKWEEATMDSAIFGTGAYSTTTGKKDLGDEIDFSMVYNYSADVQLGLSYAYFMPGKVFDSDNDDDASSLCGSMKVSF